MPVRATSSRRSRPSCPKIQTNSKTRARAVAEFIYHSHGERNHQGLSKAFVLLDAPRPELAGLGWKPMRNRKKQVLPPLSVGEMTLRLYAALNYSQNIARDLRRALNGA